MKFKEHDGLIFKMLDNPVQLKEKNTNVLVQFITHGVIGEYVMEHWLDCGQENAPIFVDSVDSDGDVTVEIENGNEHICCPFPMFEIIGYPVADGSRWWALYQMMQGLKVCNPQLAKDKAARLGCDDETFNTYWYVVGDTVVEGKGDYGTLSVSSWIAASSSTGWEIYKEPETYKEPIADCGSCRHSCTNSNIDYCQMYEPTFKVGDWVEFTNLGGRKSQGKYMSNTDGNAIIVLDTTSNMRVVVHTTKIIRKLSPSEVIVHIGCMSGTVSFADSDMFHIGCMSGTVSFADSDMFILEGIGNSEMSNACIMFKMLDTRTRELVESLLKAQEEK